MADRTALALSKRTQGLKRLSSVFRTVFGLALAVSLWAGERTPDQLIRQVEQRYNATRTLRVQFDEQLTIEGRRRPLESGTVTLQKPGKMRWDYARPAGKLFISDGKAVYLYTAGDNRVEKFRLRDTEDMRAPLAFLLGHLDLKKEFRNFTMRPDTDGAWLAASAKSDRVPYERVEMLIAVDGAIRKLNVAARDNSAMAFQFSNEVLNPATNPKLFHFDLPPGAEVVDSVGFETEGR